MLLVSPYWCCQSHLGLCSCWWWTRAHKHHRWALGCFDAEEPRPPCTVRLSLYQPALSRCGTAKTPFIHFSHSYPKNSSLEVQCRGAGPKGAVSRSIWCGGAIYLAVFGFFLLFFSTFSARSVSSSDPLCIHRTPCGGTREEMWLGSESGG